MLELMSNQPSYQIHMKISTAPTAATSIALHWELVVAKDPALISALAPGEEDVDTDEAVGPSDTVDNKDIVEDIGTAKCEVVVSEEVARLLTDESLSVIDIGLHCGGIELSL